jgi:hypothetical protein
MMQDAYTRLNEEIDLDVRLGGDIKIGPTLNGVI